MEAERLRIIYSMITNSREDGGAGITPKRGDWEEVESIFPLHDHAFNKKWMKSWSSSYLLELKDQDGIRNKFGEKVSVMVLLCGPATDLLFRSHSTSPSFSNISSPSSSRLLLDSPLGCCWETSRPSTPSLAVSGVSSSSSTGSSRRSIYVCAGNVPGYLQSRPNGWSSSPKKKSEIQ